MTKILEKKPCLFLDRDGVLIEDIGHPHKVEHIQILEGAVELIQWAKRKNRFVVVLTNQSGLAKGLFTLSAYHQFTQILDSKFKELNAPIDAWYFCPNHPDATVAEFKIDDDRRKPRPGMFFDALKDFPIDTQSSFMVGDKDSDILEDIHLRTFLLKGRYELKTQKDVFNSHFDLLKKLKEIYGE